MNDAAHDLDRYAQNRLHHFEDCATAIDHLFQYALQKDGTRAFDQFWDFTQKFNNLSIYNSMLVMIQRPGATAVGTIAQWKEIGRHITPDAVPIIILHPFGPVHFIYELGDTAGKPVPAQEKNSLFASGVALDTLWKRVIKAAEKYNVEIVESQQQVIALVGTAASFTDYPSLETGKKRCFRVKLNANHDLPTRFAILAHELGHIYCGHIGRDHKGRWPNRSKLTSATHELEAEAVAWLVCQRNGITTRSKDYLSSLIRKANHQQVSMYAIFEAANRVESRTTPKKK